MKQLYEQNRGSYSPSRNRDTAPRSHSRSDAMPGRWGSPARWPKGDAMGRTTAPGIRCARAAPILAAPQHALHRREVAGPADADPRPAAARNGLVAQDGRGAGVDLDAEAAAAGDDAVCEHRLRARPGGDDRALDGAML